jgi:hypothetical protein
MKRALLSLVLVIGVLVVWGGSALAAPPANDNFANAVTIGGLPFSNSGASTVGATTEANEQFPCASISATVWYKFTAGTTQTIVADTFGSDYDTVLAAYEDIDGTLANLKQINCNDDFAGVQSQLLVVVTAGKTYYLQIGGFFGATGNPMFNARVWNDGNDDVTIDIKPGSSPNSINPNSQGVIPVAILTTDDFDAADADPATIAFGREGEEGASAAMDALEDVDGDGDLDLIMHFRTQETGIQPGDKKACLTGETFGLEHFGGCDTVRTVPPGTDTDEDGFGDAVEATLTTPQFVGCYKAGVYLGWPPDLNGDQSVDIQDLNAVVPKLFTSPPRSPYSVRYDVHDPTGTSGPIVIDIQDLNAIVPFLFVSCP